MIVMEFNLTVLLVMVGVLVVGWVIGFLDSNLRAEKRIKEAERQARLQVEGAQKDDSLLRLWRDEAQTLRLEVDGNPLQIGALTAEQRRRLATLLTQVRPWLDGAPASPPVATGLNQAAATPATGRDQTAALPAVAKTKEKLEKPVTAPSSIVAQIDALLQQRLVSTPLADIGVHLKESPSGGVVVWVGLQHFEGIDSVPDPQVKAIIRQAVAAWEKRG
jgi:hypothetical protein